jgi:hypothetical protein
MSITVISETKLPSDPKIIGPGTWFTIHTMAMACGDIEACTYFIQFVKVIIDSFPCNQCRLHALKFLQENPPEEYIDEFNDLGEQIGMFKWTWVFHNNANKLTGKPLLSYSEAWRLYSEQSLCRGDCSS